MKLILALMLTALLGIQTNSASAAKSTVRIDGSSTVYPISAAIAEEFQNVKKNKNIRVTVAYSGTGGGFKKWCKGETDINDASRPIKKKEIDCAAKNKISYIELPVAYDGISVVISKKNTFIKELTVEQLKALWEPNSGIKKWSDLNPSWPNKAIKLYGPGTDSGTFDYFTEAIMHKARASRSDYTASEDDNVLVKGISNDPYALGYFGYAYYLENKNKLKVVPLVNKKKTGAKAIAPSEKSIKDNSYALARPIFIYVSSASAAKPEVRSFVNFYMTKSMEIANQVGYTPLSSEDTNKILKKFKTFLTSLKIS